MSKYLTPDITTGVTTRSFYIPTHFLPYFVAFLHGGCFADRWEAFGNMTPSQCAQDWLAMIEGAYTFNMNEVGAQLNSMESDTQTVFGLFTEIMAIVWPLLSQEEQGLISERLTRGTSIAAGVMGYYPIIRSLLSIV